MDDTTTTTFTIPDAVHQVVIGPVESAFQACREEEQPIPACWQTAPATLPGGTVLVNDVDVRVPVLSGEWKAGKLYSFVDCQCGGMVWHSSIGSEEDAAKLLHDMENAGGCPTANVENEQIQSMGIRFIGRYSWKEPRAEPEDSIGAELYQNAWVHFRGPQCVFMPVQTFQLHLLPDLLHRLRDMQQRLQTITEQRLAAGEVEAYRAQFKELAMREDTFIDIAHPPVTVFNNAGVMYTFRQHEYMFGRLWFTADMKCKAFCFYTYAAPSYFGQMRLGVTPICSKLPKLAPDRSLWDNYFETLSEALMTMSDETCADALNNLTNNMREDLYYSCRYSGPTLLKRVFSLNLLSVSAKFFRTMVSKSFVSSTAHDAVALEVISHTPDHVLQEVIHADEEVYHTVNNGLAGGSYDLENPTAEMLGHRRPSLLADFIAKPEVLKVLLQRGFPPNTMLSDTRFEWFRNVLCEAASQGLVDTVKLLLDAGADVNSVVCGDHWPTAIVYAADSGSEECLALMRERFPDHEIWSRNDIPLERKKLPQRKAPAFPTINAFGSKPSDTPVPPQPEFGTLENIRMKAQQRKLAMAAPPAPPVAFSFGSFSFPAK